MSAPIQKHRHWLMLANGLLAVLLAFGHDWLAVWFLVVGLLLVVTGFFLLWLPPEVVYHGFATRPDLTAGAVVLWLVFAICDRSLLWLVPLELFWLFAASLQWRKGRRRVLARVLARVTERTS